MNTNLFNLPPDSQFSIFSWLNREELISTIPLVCDKFNKLSKNENFWNHLRIKRPTIQMAVNFPLQYTNQIAMRHLKLNEVKDFQKIADLTPFEQRSLILDFLARKIQEHSNSEGKSPLDLTCSKTHNKWIESANHSNSKTGVDTSYFTTDQAIKIHNAICPESHLNLFSEDPQFLMTVLYAATFHLNVHMPRIVNQIQQGIFQLPLKLRHMGTTGMGNTDAIGSVLQTLLCIDCIREQFKHGNLAISEETEVAGLKKNLAIQQEILQFIPELSKNDLLNHQELISFLLKEPSLLRLKQALFDSDILAMKQPNDPINASQLMEFFIHTFLPNYHFELDRHATTTDFLGYEFITRERISLLPISLRNQTKYQSLEMLIKTSLGKVVHRKNDINHQRLFDPKEGIVVDQEKVALCQASSAKKVSKHIEWCRFRDLPPVLFLCFNRSTFDPINERFVRNTSPVYLPENGMIDLSCYSDVLEGENHARYKIKSYLVVHFTGPAFSDERYTSSVEINGKYYDCDGGNREITQEKFLSSTNPYIIILERISEED